MKFKTSQGETVTTDELRVGDVVYVHGAVFKLTSVREYMPGPGGCAGPVFSFKTEVLDAGETEIPAHWLGDWTIQGNRLAKWCRLVSHSEVRP